MRLIGLLGADNSEELILAAALTRFGFVAHSTRGPWLADLKRMASEDVPGNHFVSEIHEAEQAQMIMSLGGELWVIRRPMIESGAGFLYTLLRSLRFLPRPSARSALVQVCLPLAHVVLVDDDDPEELETDCEDEIRHWLRRHPELSRTSPPSPAPAPVVETVVVVLPVPVPEPVSVASAPAALPLEVQTPQEPAKLPKPLVSAFTPAPQPSPPAPDLGLDALAVSLSDIMFDRPDHATPAAPLLGDTPAETEVLADMIVETVHLEPYQELAVVVGEQEEASLPERPKPIVSPPAVPAAASKPVRRRSRVGEASLTPDTTAATAQAAPVPEPEEQAPPPAPDPLPTSLPSTPKLSKKRHRRHRRS